ncbi:MAG: pyridoxal phosphate-dependent aminotransferase [Dehalococcoidia bacterium]|nr:pyridoxal phosphate-dependent aminotransferase [Dehalococcoidia bacterium]
MITIPDRVRSVAMPPIDALNTHMSRMNAEGGDVISLGQSVPFFGPPPQMLDAVRDAIDNFGPRLHTYGPDAGIPDLRHARARKLREFNRVSFDPDTQLVVTPGSNQAFMVAMTTILEQGDEVAIASPYYFNHHMAIELCGGVVREIPLSEEDGFQMTMEDVEEALTERTRAVVIISPNNPTGTVYRAEEIATITRELTERGIYVICDDAYEVFCYDGARHTSVAGLSGYVDNVITLGSLSKTFGMTGWRIGYIAANAELCRQALKVQDAMAICAPIISQVAATAALEQMPEHPLSMISELDERRRVLEATLDKIPVLHWYKTDGALFAMVGADVAGEDRELAWELLDRAQVLTVPGSAFGAQWGGFLRISYGCSPRDRYEEALSRLVEYFERL